MDRITLLTMETNPDKIGQLETELGILQADAARRFLAERGLTDAEPPKPTVLDLARRVLADDQRRQELNSGTNMILGGILICFAWVLFISIVFKPNFVGMLSTAVMGYTIVPLLVMSAGYYAVTIRANDLRSIKHYLVKIPLLVLAGIFCEIMAYANSYMFCGLNQGGDNTKPVSDLASAIYFSAITYTTVGYGDITPSVGWSQFFAASEALTGLVLNAALLAALLGIFRSRE